MKYVVATIGGIFIFLAVFFLTALVLAGIAPNVVKFTIAIGAFRTNNIPGLILGATAAWTSVRATLKRYNKKADEMRKSKGS